MASISSIICMVSIKNGVLARLSSVSVPYSNMNLSILAILERDHIIQGFSAEGRFIRVSLANSDGLRRRIKDLRVYSKPSNPMFVSLRSLSRINSFMGSSLDSLNIVSTNRGILTLNESIRFGVGGELLFVSSKLVSEIISHR